MQIIIYISKSNKNLEVNLVMFWCHLLKKNLKNPNKIMKVKIKFNNQSALQFNNKIIFMDIKINKQMVKN